MGLLQKQNQHEYYSGGIDTLGNYQFTSLDTIIHQFMISYVGEGKLITKVKKADVAFHAQRALQELSFDTFKSCKSQEIELPPSLIMPLPQDYVNYVKIAWSDSAGIERIIYPTRKTSNPNSVAQDADGHYLFENSDNLFQFPMKLTIAEILPNQTVHEFSPKVQGSAADPNFPFAAGSTNPLKIGMEIVSEYFPVGTTITALTTASGTNSDEYSFTTSNESINDATTLTDIVVEVIDNTDGTTWGRYKSSGGPISAGSEHLHGSTSHRHYDEHSHGRAHFFNTRYGIDPQHSHVNGSFFIDCQAGKVHFSSNLSGKNVILHYISDSLGTDAEMQVHKFAEEAVYKHISYGILSTRIGIPEYIINRAKKERFATKRVAKLRLSNIKLEEITQILRGKSKWIKH